MRWLDTSTVRPSAARPFINRLIHTTPSGSRPFTGSSRMSTSGSPSSAAATPSRCRIPSDNARARFRAAPAMPVASSTADTRRSPIPLLRANHRRCSRTLRLGCRSPASNSAPTCVNGRSSDAYARPPTVAVPPVGRSIPRIRRIVVDFPAPFGPRNPVTRPGATENDNPSTAVPPRYRLRKSLTSIMRQP